MYMHTDYRVDANSISYTITRAYFILASYVGHVVSMCVCSCSIVTVFSQCIIVVDKRVLLSTHSTINMITNAINAAVAYIGASRRVCTTPDGMSDIIANQVASLKVCINNAPHDLTDVTSAMTILHGAPFGDAHRDDLVARIHAKTQSSVAGGEPVKQSPTSQVHHFIFNYMTSAVWEKQTDRNCTEMDRVIDMVCMCHRIGLYFADVASRKIIVATMILAQGASPSPRGAKAMYDMFAAINNDRRPLRKNAAHTPRTVHRSSMFTQLYTRMTPSPFRVGYRNWTYTTWQSPYQFARPATF